MNKYDKKNIITIIIGVILAVIVVIVIVIFNNQTIVYKAKLELQEQESNKIINELAEISSKQSNIELLGEGASIAATNAKETLEYIEKLKAEIKAEEKEYEFQLLTQRCFEWQIYRMTNLLAYGLDYCKDEANLEEFRTKKY